MLKFPTEVPAELEFDIKSISEEKANMWSHGIGWIMAIIGTPFLINFAFASSDSLVVYGTLLYCFSLVMVYTSSTLYHTSYVAATRKKLRTFDHISIYFLIAGSFTPFIFTSVRTTTGYTVLIILWSMVLLGSIFKLFFTHRFKVMSTLAYLVMGWMAVFVIKPLYVALPSASFKWLALGGLFYTLGTVFYLWKTLYMNHFIWHLFVMGGSISHFLAVLFLLQSKY